MTAMTANLASLADRVPVRIATDVHHRISGRFRDRQRLAAIAAGRYGTSRASVTAASPAGSSHPRPLPEITPPASRAAPTNRTRARISSRRDTGHAPTVVLEGTVMPGTYPACAVHAQSQNDSGRGAW